MDKFFEIKFKKWYNIRMAFNKSVIFRTHSHDEEFKKCWALENLQPMEKIANIKKGNKYA